MSALIARRTEFWWSERQRPRPWPASRRDRSGDTRAEAVTVRRSAVRTRHQEGGASPPPANSAQGRASGGSKGAEPPLASSNVAHWVSWLMNLSLRLRGGARTRPSTTPLPGRARPRRTSRLPHCPPPVRSRTPELWRRNATFGIAGSSSAWSFSAPRDACGAQGRTYHGFRQRTVGSHVIALRIYGMIYGTDESNQYLQHL